MVKQRVEPIISVTISSIVLTVVAEGLRQGRSSGSNCPVFGSFKRLLRPPVAILTQPQAESIARQSGSVAIMPLAGQALPNRFP